MYHLLRADEFSAAEALRIGLVQEVVAPGTQVSRAVDLAREIATCAPFALVHTKANARLALDENEPAAIAAIEPMRQAVMASACVGKWPGVRRERNTVPSTATPRAEASCSMALRTPEAEPISWIATLAKTMSNSWLKVRLDPMPMTRRLGASSQDDSECVLRAVNARMMSPAATSAMPT